MALTKKKIVKFEKAEKKAKDSSEYESLAESIRENLGDKKWAKLVDKKNP